MKSPIPATAFSGLDYVIRAIKLLTDPGLKRFVLIPVAANLVIFIVLSYFFIQLLGDISESLLAFLPDWLNFLAYILWILILLLFFLIYGYSFTLLTNLIAAPFYGLLSEKIAAKLTTKAPTGKPLPQMILRTIGREITKLCYFFSYGALVFVGLTLLAFIPLVNIAVPLLGFLWSSWVMTIQYADYAADNNNVPFKKLRQQLGTQRWASMSLGGYILLGSMVPIVNIVIAPVAVAAGTLYWVEKFSDKVQL